MRRGLWGSRRRPRAADRKLGPGLGLALAVVLSVLLFWLPLLAWLGWI